MNFKVFLPLVLISSSCVVNATEVANCSESEKRFIQSKITSGLSVSDISFSNRSELKLDYICSIQNEVMNDGLSAAILKRRDSSEKYIEIINGLDGSIMYYGPFVE